jgi:hypothetical protein
MLPSDILAKGSTFDMYVLDVATRWVKYQQEQADGKESVTKRTSRSQPTQQEMLAMIERVKQKGAANGNKD